MMRRLVEVQEQMLGEMQGMRGDIHDLRVGQDGLRQDVQGLGRRIDRLVENQGDHYRRLEERVDRLEKIVLPPE